MAGALAALRSGDRSGAERCARTVLEADPDEAAAHFMLATLAEADGRLIEAGAAYARAIACAPRNPGFRIAAGNLALARDDAAGAEASYRQAMAIDPFSAAVHINLGHALKRQGRLRDALHHYRQSLELGRPSPWFAHTAIRGGRTDPLRAESFASISRAKLDHDIEQFEHLRAKGLLPSGFDAQLDGYRAVRDSLDPAVECAPMALQPQQASRIAASYNRVVHLPRQQAFAGEALNPALDFPAIERRYADASPPLAVVDDLLDADALAQLRAFCLDATIWFDCKADDGYVGAYLHDGFAPPALLALAEALPRRLPGIFGTLCLSQMWAFKYRAEGRGTRPHADEAAVNVNFWITPDEAALPGRAGGLRIWDRAAPEDWAFDAYNREPAAVEAHLAAAGARPVDLPYRCNRAAIFDSSLFHESLPFAFRPGYANRRINVTMLFGRRAAARPGAAP